MTTYADYKAQIAALKKEADAARQNEIAKAKTQIKDIMNEYGLTIADLSKGAKSGVAVARVPVAAQFRDPVSGAEWSGRGRAPLWLAGKDKEAFRIK